MSRTVFIATESGEQSQYSREQIEAIWKGGHLGPDTLYWMEGMSEWRPLRELLGGAPGKVMKPSVPALSSNVGQETVLFSEYAGFWRRVVAYLIDGVAIWLLTYVGIFAFGLMVPETTDELLYEVIGSFVGVVIAWLYFATMESSSTHATLGKMALGLQVTDLEGRGIGFGRATGRYFGKFVSGLIFLIGYLMVAFTEKKQGLHDMMAGCLVVK